MSKDKRTQEGMPKRVRNNPVTRRVIMDAALAIIREQGIRGLTVTGLAKRAGRAPRTVYDNFGSLQGVLVELAGEFDDWLLLERELEGLLEDHRADHGRELAPELLKYHFRRFHSDGLLQQVALMELSGEYRPIMRDIVASRERLGEKLFALSDGHFKNRRVSLRMVCALLIAGMDYLVLHHASLDTTFCGMDIGREEDREVLLSTVKLVLEWAYGD